ncbi:MAG: hypothetical protein OEV73_01410 [Desulfobulbaceae bacterium]|nr:hypothetical protein [Desulfobulbaceae bacterium]
MGCCYKLGPAPRKQNAILPKHYVLPVRIVILVSLAATSTYALFHLTTLSPLFLLGFTLHLTIAARALSECRKSVAYHRSLAKFEEEISSHS